MGHYNTQTSAVFRAYIGPVPIAADSDDAYGKWDWPNAIGSIYSIPPYMGTGALTTRLARTDTSGFGVSGLSLPAVGGVWVGPKQDYEGDDQGWEYIAYLNSHAGANSLKRQVEPGVNGIHAIGAPVNFWYPLDTNNGNLQYTQELSDNMSAVTWTCKMGGVRAPNTILKPEHFFMVTWSEDPSLPESAWKMLLLGVIEKITLTQNTQNLAEWSVEVNSTARLLQTSSVPSLRIGPLDIALEAKTEASSTLGAAWKFALQQKEQAEFGEIEELDVIEVQSDMGPDNLTDGNMDTLWVSDGWVGPASAFANSKGVVAWASLFFYPPPTELFGSRYIEIINHEGLHMVRLYVFMVYNSTTGRKAKWYDVTDGDMFSDNNVPDGDGNWEPEDRIVIAEDGATFQRNFPTAKPKWFLDASGFSDRDAEVVRRLWWEGGAIFMAWGPSFAGEDYLVYWGDTNPTELEDMWDAQALSSISLPLPARANPSMAAAKPGKVLRREMQTGDGDWAFTWDWFHHPGYIISNDQNDDQFANWLKITLPEMSHILAFDIGVSSTIIYLTDTQDNPNVEGLSLHGAGGAIWIDDDLITYTGKDYYAGTLTGCTVHAGHKAGARAYANWHTPWYGENSAQGKPFQDKIFDLATAAYPISKLKWGRGYFKASGNGRSPFPGSFVWRFSMYENADTAYQDHHEADYFSEVVIDSENWLTFQGENILVPNATVNTTTNYFNPASDGFRPRTLLMEFRKMFNAAGTEIPDRPRLNYITVEVDRRYFNPLTWIDVPPSGMANSLLIMQIFQLSGQWPSQFSTFSTAGDPTPLSRAWGQTDRGTGWQVGTDMADYGGNIIRCDRNGRIRIGLQRYLNTLTHDATRYLSEDDVTSVEIVNIRPAEVGQVRLKWENGLTKANGVVVYPDTVRKGGSISDVGPMLANTEADAQVIAFNMYQAKRFPYNIFYELSMSDMTVQVGDIHALQFPFYFGGEINYKYMLIETVDQEFSNGTYKTVIGAREIRRDWV
jgi:hypothetical protein